MTRGCGREGDSCLPGRHASDALQVISKLNVKAGSRKTTTAIHLAQRHALRGYPLLVMGIDPQASLTTRSGYRREIECAKVERSMTSGSMRTPCR